MCDTVCKDKLEENFTKISNLRDHHKSLYPEFCHEKQLIKDEIHELEDQRIRIKKYYSDHKLMCYDVNTVGPTYSNSIKHYESLLYHAVYHNNVEVVDCLLYHNADPNVKGDEDVLPVQLAIKNNNECLAIKLFEKMNKHNITNTVKIDQVTGMDKLDKLIKDQESKRNQEEKLINQL